MHRGGEKDGREGQYVSIRGEINLGERERIRVIVLLLPRNYLCPGYVGVFLLSGPQHSARAKRNETEYPGGRERERVL